MTPKQISKLAALALVVLLYTSAFASDAVDYAELQIGKPYELGQAGPDAFDCSGLTKFAYDKVGIQIPRVSRQQGEIGIPVIAPFVRGDLLFFSTDDRRPGVVTHVGMFEAGTTMVDANSYNNMVTHDDISTRYWSQRLLFARRVIPQPVASFVMSSGSQTASSGQAFTKFQGRRS